MVFAENIPIAYAYEVVDTKLHILAWFSRFPELSEIDGGELIRPLELIYGLSEQGVATSILTENATTQIPVERMELSQNKLVRRVQRHKQARAWLIREAEAAHAAGSIPILYRKIPSDMRVVAGFAALFTDPFRRIDTFAASLGIRIWNTMHDLAPDHTLTIARRLRASGVLGLRRQFNLSMHAYWEELQQRRCLTANSILTVVSQSLKEKALRKYPLQADRIHVLRSGFRPQLLDPVSQWIPPKERRWRVGYLGSGNDSMLAELVQALQQLKEVDVVVGGRDVQNILSKVRNSENIRFVEAVRYSDFAQFAEDVDVWVVHYGDDPYLDQAWQLKIPMYMASGRPLMMTSTRELAYTGLQDLVWKTGRTVQDVCQTLTELMANPIQAKDRADRAQARARAEMKWSDRVTEVKEFLESLVLAPHRD